ncbi:hypothetical protein AB2N04_13455 [Nitratireductor sp. GISD-1A_MAKvit]|uniref:hypothetical protein n=1 Tax=Nitratireductor sp. GISD-1A_MAKvit TaxID=3234198 RepID=UPI003467822F
MNDRYDAYAAATIVTFGAIVIGGLMAAALSFGERDAFFFALGAGTAAWGAGYAMFLDRGPPLSGTDGAGCCHVRRSRSPSWLLTAKPDSSQGCQSPAVKPH